MEVSRENIVTYAQYFLHPVCTHMLCLHWSSTIYSSALYCKCIQWGIWWGIAMWLLTMLYKYFRKIKSQTNWGQFYIIAILKSGKYSAIPKCYRPISPVSHTYELYRRMILNRTTLTLIGIGFVDLSAAYHTVNRQHSAIQHTMLSYPELSVKQKSLCGAVQQTKHIERRE